MFATRKITLAQGFLIGLLASQALTGCKMPGFKRPTPAGVEAIQTAAAQTVQAQLTQDFRPTDTPGIQTAMPSQTLILLPSSTVELLSSPSPTQIPATFTQIPATPTPIPCDLVKFIADVTIPDNTELEPGATFVKTWRLQNAGSCAWTSAYALVPDGDNVFNAPALTPITTGAVPPSGVVDVSVSLTAPSVAGTYRGNFKLANPSGQRFALGDGTKPFWAQVKVVAPTVLTFDFIASASLAEWKSGAGNTPDTLLAFGGADDDPNGVAKIKTNALLENGAQSGKVLLTAPKHLNNGMIAGTFPPYLIQGGDSFKARLGFLAKPDGKCGTGQVKFQVYYKEGSSILLLNEWSKSCDGKLLSVSIDLSPLKGKTVQILLVVKANGSYADDWAIWSSPQIGH